MKGALWKAIRILWIVVSLLALGGTLILLGKEGQEDIGIIFVYVMGALSFPVSVAWLVVAGTLYGLAHKLFGVFASGGHLEIVLNWLALFVLGYLQWFWVVPTLIKRFRTTTQQRR